MICPFDKQKSILSIFKTWNNIWKTKVVTFEMCEELHQQYIKKKRIINSTSVEMDHFSSFR